MSDINLGKILSHYCFKWSLQVALVVRNPLANAGDVRDLGLIPGLGRSLGWEDPLQEGMATLSSIPAWRIPMDRGAWQATVHGVTRSRI